MPGKDSQRHAAAGAATAAFVTPGRTTVRRFRETEPLEALLRRSFSHCDLVLVEGYKSLPIPKIEVVRTGVSRPDVVEPAARVSDGPFSGSVPTLSFGDWDGIAAAVVRLAGLDRRDSPMRAGTSPENGPRTSRGAPVLAEAVRNGIERPRVSGLRPRRHADRRLRRDRRRPGLRDGAAGREAASARPGPRDGRPRSRIAPRGGRRGGARAAEGVRLFRERYPEVAVAKSHLLPGVAETLEELASRGHRMALASNKPAPFSRMILEAKGVAGHFSAIGGPDAETPAKPDPSMLRRLMDGAGAAPEDDRRHRRHGSRLRIRARGRLPRRAHPGRLALA